MEPALSTENPRQGHPVHPDQADQQRPHRPPGQPQDASARIEGRAHGSTRTPAAASDWRISVSSSCVLAGRKPFRATTTTPVPARTAGAIRRHAARNTRRARLRWTAPPTLRPATNAARARPGTGATNSITRVPTRRFPEDRVRLISVRPRRRGRAGRCCRTPLSRIGVRPTAVPGPWPGAWPGWPARRASASEPGTRGSWTAGGCWAGRSSSPLTRIVEGSPVEGDGAASIAREGNAARAPDPRGVASGSGPPGPPPVPRRSERASIRRSDLAAPTDLGYIPPVFPRAPPASTPAQQRYRVSPTCGKVLWIARCRLHPKNRPPRPSGAA